MRIQDSGLYVVSLSLAKNLDNLGKKWLHRVFFKKTVLEWSCHIRLDQKLELWPGVRNKSLNST